MAITDIWKKSKISKKKSKKLDIFDIFNIFENITIFSNPGSMSTIVSFKIEGYSQF